MDADRGARGLGGIVNRARVLARQRRRIGIEAETDLAAALVDERRQPVGERLRAQAPLTALDVRLQRRTGGEPRHLAARDRYPLAGAWVDALAGSALGDVELPEPGEVHLSTAAKDAGDRVEDGVDGLARRLLAAKSLVIGESVQELSFGHVDPPRALKWRAI
jgi:hypothetical protein